MLVSMAIARVPAWRELVLTVAAVKTHLRTLFKTFGIDELPQQEKRLQLVALAFSSGLVADRDL